MFAVAARGLVPPSVPGAPALDPVPHDPALARALLAESGFDMSRPIDLVYSQAAWALGERVIAGVVDDLAAVGLSAVPRRAGDLAEVRRSGDYDVVEAMWMGDYLDPDAFTFAVFHSGVGAYRGIHSSAELDELMSDARGTTDLARRAALYDSIEKRFRERCGVLALLHPKDFVLQAQDVEGLDLYPQPPNVRPRELWLRGAGGPPAGAGGL
jgi:ABC-type transport system substrate-binding protein